jgi:hypothetical protein
MKLTALGLLLACALVGTRIPALAQTNLSIWVGAGPVAGVQYSTYGNYYFYPNPVAGSFQVIYNPQYRAYGWWDGRRHWHAWTGPQAWNPHLHGFHDDRGWHEGDHGERGWHDHRDHH